MTGFHVVIDSKRALTCILVCGPLVSVDLGADPCAGADKGKHQAITGCCRP